MRQAPVSLITEVGRLDAGKFASLATHVLKTRGLQRLLYRPHSTARRKVLFRRDSARAQQRVKR